MTIDPVELERLAQDLEVDAVRHFEPAVNALTAIADKLRTGQLVPAQPSGDEVEAVALAILNSDRGMRGLDPLESRENVPDSDGYVTNATAAITAYEAASGVAHKFNLGDRVTKTKGSSWTGLVVGFYSTSLTPIGYAVESENEPGSVQIYPESALEACLKARENGDG